MELSQLYMQGTRLGRQFYSKITFTPIRGKLNASGVLKDLNYVTGYWREKRWEPRVTSSFTRVVLHLARWESGFPALLTRAIYGKYELDRKKTFPREMGDPKGHSVMGGGPMLLWSDTYLARQTISIMTCSVSFLFVVRICKTKRHW